MLTNDSSNNNTPSSAPPPPPPPPPSTPVKSNDLSTAQRVIRKNSPSDANQKDVQQKQSGTPVDARSNLLAEIRNGLTLKKVSDEQKKIIFLKMESKRATYNRETKEYIK